MADKTATRVAQATGIASSSQIGNDDLAARIEAAMQQAIRECLDQGVTDPDEQRERMLAARGKVLSD